MQDRKQKKTEKLEAFAARLGLLAGRARLKQVEIARKLGVKPQRVGSWFQAKNFPGGEIETALATLLGTTKAWLIDGEENPENPKSPEVHDVSLLNGSSGEMESKARMLLNEALLAAAGDPTRLGWIIEQLRLHLTPPAHWKRYEVGGELQRRAEETLQRRQAKEDPGSVSQAG